MADDLSIELSDPLHELLAGAGAAEWSRGHEDGRCWGRLEADAEQVARVAAVYDAPVDRLPPGGWTSLAAAVIGAEAPGPALVRRTMAALFDDEEPSASRLLGFLDGVRVVRLDALQPRVSKPPA